MIEGFVNLSLPLKRLGFIKVVVWLTQPSSYMYTTQLVTRYKETVKRYRDDFEWNKDSKDGHRVAGSGIGRFDSQPNKDSIAVSHVQLAQSLGFIKREVNTWGRFGLQLASQYANEKGKPTFLDPVTRDEMMKHEGLLSQLPLSEQFIFSNSLVTSDVDGIIPLIECINDDNSIDFLKQNYFDQVSKWYDRKSKVEPNPNKRYFYSEEKSKFAKKEKEGGYSKVHRDSQLNPRLNFLSDAGFLIKTNSSCQLTSIGKYFKNSWNSVENQSLHSLLDEKESCLGLIAADCFCAQYSEISVEEFQVIFDKISSFYKYAGLFMIPYEDLYFSMLANALGTGKGLTFTNYKNSLEQLARSRNYDLSTNMPGRRYIRT